MFQLTDAEFAEWKSQIATSNLKSQVAKFNRQYKNLTVDFSEKSHDRFLIIDNAELHNLGSSINCLGRRVTTHTTRDPKEIAKVQAEI